MTPRRSSSWSFVLLVSAAGLAAGIAACKSDGPSGSEPDAGSAPDGGDTPPGETPPKCVTPTGEGTVHSSSALASDDEVWTAAGSPHVVTFPVTIRAGQKLTIEPCAVVRLEAKMSVLVDGELIAEGAADQPISFERAGAEPWEYIRVSDTGHARFAYATLAGGGHVSNNRPDSTATLYVDGDPRSPTGASSRSYALITSPSKNRKRSACS
jgi:hypothetical protein